MDNANRRVMGILCRKTVQNAASRAESAVAHETSKLPASLVDLQLRECDRKEGYSDDLLPGGKPGIAPWGGRLQAG